MGEPCTNCGFAEDTPHTGTRDWKPTPGEFRPSMLGACARYAWHKMQNPTLDEAGPVGRTVLFAAGHAAEHAFLETEQEAGRNLILGLELDNGFGGICHPDAVDADTDTVMEIKFTGYKKPAPYHVAQIQYYMHQLTQQTGRIHRGEIILLSKHGEAPSRFPVEPLEPEAMQQLLAKAKSIMGDEPPEGVCSTRADSQNVRHYDAGNPWPRANQNMVCPAANDCFPTNDDFEV